MRNYLATLASPIHYAPIQTWTLDHDKHAHLRAVPHGATTNHDLPTEWTTSTSGPWTIVTPPRSRLQEQGWKIHLAPSVPRAHDVVERAVRLLVARRLPFKYLSRLEYVWAANGKYAPRSASGKTVVVYPPAQTDLDELLTSLYVEFADEEGPRVLGSDRLFGSIVHLRYGGFVEMRTRDAAGDSVTGIRDATGALVPDRRGVTPYVPDFAAVPGILEQSRHSVPVVSDGAGDHHVYRIVSALHFSNTGGVYRATDTTTGRDVVLKEARHHTGYDAGMNSAPVRLARQRDAMRALASSGAVPAVVEHFTQGDSDFLAYDFVPGSTLQEWSAAHNPALLQTAPDRPLTASDRANFRERVQQYIYRLAQIVADVHALGYLVCDIHPANIIVGDDGRLSLIDLEGAVPLADVESTFVGAQGFFSPGATGVEIDRRAIAATELYLYAPMVPTVSYIDDAATRIIDFACETYGLDGAWADRIQRVMAAPVSDVGTPGIDSLVVGLLRTTDPDADTFPTSPDGHEDTGRFGVSWGLPGVLWALSRAGDVPAELVDGYFRWIDRHRDDFTEYNDGLLDGWGGNTVVCAELGLADRSADLLDQLVTGADISGAPLDLRHGVAGLLLACLWHRHRTPDLIDDGMLEKTANVLVDRVTEMRGSISTGLLDGAAGIALALGRVHAVIPHERYAVTARMLIDDEFATYRPHATGALHHWDGRSRLLGYLDRGNSGFAAAAAELAPIAPLPDGALAGIQRGACARIGVQPGLYIGLAGGIVANAELARSSSMDPAYLARCNDRIARGVSVFTGTSGGNPVVAGLGGIRASHDFASGTAGIVTAMAFASGITDAWLPGVF